jgi:hypothetical protein
MVSSGVGVHPISHGCDGNYKCVTETCHRRVKRVILDPPANPCRICRKHFQPNMLEPARGSPKGCLDVGSCSGRPPSPDVGEEAIESRPGFRSRTIEGRIGPGKVDIGLPVAAYDRVPGAGAGRKKD